jgi:hypothetical protein
MGRPFTCSGATYATRGSAVDGPLEPVLDAHAPVGREVDALGTQARVGPVPQHGEAVHRARELACDPRRHEGWHARATRTETNERGRERGPLEVLGDDDADTLGAVVTLGRVDHLGEDGRRRIFDQGTRASERLETAAPAYEHHRVVGRARDVGVGHAQRPRLTHVAVLHEGRREVARGTSRREREALRPRAERNDRVRRHGVGRRVGFDVGPHVQAHARSQREIELARGRRGHAEPRRRQPRAEHERMPRHQIDGVEVPRAAEDLVHVERTPCALRERDDPAPGSARRDDALLSRRMAREDTSRLPGLRQHQHGDAGRGPHEDLATVAREDEAALGLDRDLERRAPRRLQWCGAHGRWRGHRRTHAKRIAQEAHASRLVGQGQRETARLAPRACDGDVQLVARSEQAVLDHRRRELAEAGARLAHRRLVTDHEELVVTLAAACRRDPEVLLPRREGRLRGAEGRVGLEQRAHARLPHEGPQVRLAQRAPEEGHLRFGSTSREHDQEREVGEARSTERERACIEERDRSLAPVWLRAREIEEEQLVRRSAAQEVLWHLVEQGPLAREHAIEGAPARDAAVAVGLAGVATRARERPDGEREPRQHAAER